MSQRLVAILHLVSFHSDHVHWQGRLGTTCQGLLIDIEVAVDETLESCAASKRRLVRPLALSAARRNAEHSPLSFSIPEWVPKGRHNYCAV